MEVEEYNNNNITSGSSYGGVIVESSIIEEESSSSLHSIVEGLEISYVQGDFHRGVAHYVRLLNRHLALKYIIPTPSTQLNSLVTTLNHLIIHPDLDLELQAKWCKTLTKLLRKYKKSITVTIEWRPLYEMLIRHHFGKSRTSEYTGRMTEKFHAYALHSLIYQARRFFSANASEEIMNEFRPYLCPNDTIIFRTVGLLSLFLPTFKHHVFKTEWISEILSIWGWVEMSPGWDQMITSLLARIAKHQAGNIDWTQYNPVVFTHFLRIIDVAVGSGKLPKSKKTTFPSESAILVPFHTSSFTNMGKAIVYMLGPTNNTFELLTKMLVTIESFFHPSNSGQWTDSLAQLLRELCRDYAKRVGDERRQKSDIPSNYKLDKEKYDSRFITLMLPLTLKGMYSKSNSMASSARLAIKHLCHIKPDQVFPQIIEIFYSGLETLTATHQTLSVIETLGTIAGSLVSPEYPEGAQYLADLLNLTLPGIDPNDAEKTRATVKFYYRILSYVPLVEESSKQPVTSIFPEWAALFLEKIFSLLGNKDKDEKGSGEWWWLPFLRTTFKLLYAQSSPQIYDMLLKKLHKQVSSSVVSNATKEFGFLIESACIASPKVAFKQFIPSFYTLLVQENHSEALLKDLAENEYLWYLSALRHLVKFGGAEILQYRKQLSNIVTSCLKHEKSKTVQQEGGKLLRNILLALTQYYPTDLRSLPPKLWNNTANFYQTWGSEYDYLSAEVEWHRPNDDELTFAVEMIQNYLFPALDAVSNVTQKRGTELNQSDNHSLYRSLVVVRYVLRGASTILPWEKNERQDAEMNRGLYPLKHLEVTLPYQLGEWRKALEAQNITTRIGATLHQLCLYLLDQKADDTSSLAQLCKVYNLFLNFRGVSSNSLKKRKGVNKMLKSKYANYVIGNSRQARVFRVEGALLHHLTRLDEFNYGLPFTLMAKYMLHDLLTLSSNTYVKVRSKAQSVLHSAFKHIPLSASEVLPSVISGLSIKTSENETHKVEGLIYLLSNKSVQRRIVKNWKLLSSFLQALCGCSIHEQITLQNQIYQLFVSFCVVYHSVPVTTNLSGLPAAQVPQELLESGRNTIAKFNSSNEELYRNLFPTLLQQLQNPLHWRYQIMISTCLMFLLRDKIAPSVDVLRWFLKNLTSDVAPLRALSSKAVSMVLTSVKNRRAIQISCETRARPEDFHKLPPLSSETWDKAQLFDKNYFGYGGPMKTIKSEISKNNQQYASVLQAAFSDSSFVARLLLYLAQDHKFKAEGPQDRFSGIPQFLQSDPRIVGFMNMFGGSAAKGNLEEQAASEIIKEFLRSNKSWPYTKASKISTGFLDSNAQFWKGVFQVGGIHLMKLLQQFITAASEDLEQQCMKAELFAGLIRAAKTWKFSECNEMFLYLVPLLDKSLSQTSVESLSEWNTALRFATYNMDPRRLTPLIGLLFSDPLKASASSSHIAKRFIFIKAVLNELSWRMPELNVSLLSLISNNLNNPYKQVRHVLGECIATIFLNLWSPHRHEQTDRPSLGLTQHQALSTFVSTVSSKLAASESITERSAEETKDIAHIRETIMHWLIYSFTNGETYAVIQYVPTLFPYLVSMQRDQDEEIAKQAGHLCALICQAFFPLPLLDSLLQSVQQIAKNPNWHIRSAILPFIQIFAFNHCFVLDTNQRGVIFNTVTQLLADPQLEVRELARVALSSLVVSLQLDIPAILQTFIQMTQSNIKKKTISDENLKQRHAAICGICAVVESSPYDVPDWMPSVVEKLASFVNDPVPIKDTVKRTLQDFWRTHQDQWETNKTKFTEDQLYTINELLISPTYYA